MNNSDKNQSFYFVEFTYAAVACLCENIEDLCLLKMVYDSLEWEYAIYSEKQFKYMVDQSSGDSEKWLALDWQKYPLEFSDLVSKVKEDYNLTLTEVN